MKIPGCLLLTVCTAWVVTTGFAANSNTPDPFASMRGQMVETQIEHRGVHDARVLASMRKVPRHEFVLQGNKRQAYDDHPLPIGFGQTISQPYIVAYMCELAGLDQSSRVLEVGTGSAYHASVMAQIAAHVYSIEIVPELAARAQKRVKKLGYKNISIRNADGYYGWSEAAPFDAIIVTAATDHIPPPLIKQLREGGRMVIPLGHAFFVQKLVLAEKIDGRVRSRDMLPVRFVPLTGSH
ncbi:MAG: protein-L-isoaspartate(D-aspartate) O-methyltransferase [Mariprofundaceae bacterium]